MFPNTLRRDDLNAQEMSDSSRQRKITSAMFIPADACAPVSVSFHKMKEKSFAHEKYITMQSGQRMAV
jgi:hypothetical protein